MAKNKNSFDKSNLVRSLLFRVPMKETTCKLIWNNIEDNHWRRGITIMSSWPTRREPRTSRKQGSTWENWSDDVSTSSHKPSLPAQTEKATQFDHLTNTYWHRWYGSNPVPNHLYRVKNSRRDIFWQDAATGAQHHSINYHCTSSAHFLKSPEFI